MKQTTMKNRTKFMAIAIAALGIFHTTNVKAQRTTSTPPPSAWRLGIGLEAGAPTGNAHDFSNFELGGTARLQYDASKSFAITLTSGYYNMFGKNVSVVTPGGVVTAKASDLGIVPVKAGIKAFLAPSFYFGAEAGAGFETISGGSTKLILSPGIGYASKSWDVDLRYENFSGQSNNYGLVGLRIAYGFAL